MTFVRHSTVMVTLLAVALLLAGCSLSVLLPDPPEVPEPVYILYSDFADDEIGKSPSGWFVESQANIQVVAAPELPSGKALRLASNGSNDRQAGINFKTDIPEIHSPVIVIEHMFKWTSGKNNMYVRIGSTSDIKIHWWATENGTLGYRNGNKNVEPDHLVLGNDWHKIRIIADRTAGTYSLYLDDTLIEENIVFSNGRAVESWEGHRISFQIPGSGEREYFIGEVKVWAPEQD